MRRIFWGFLQKLVPHESLTLLFGPFRFWLQIRGDIHIRKTTLHIGDTGSRRLPVSLSRGVYDSPHHWYAGSGTPRITESRLLNFLKRKLSVSMIRRVVNSPHQWYGESPTPHIVESPTPRITDTESQQLRVSLSRGVDDSGYRWYGESLFEKKLF